MDEEAIALLAQSNHKMQETLLQQARNLLSALNQWQENLLKVGQFLVNRQQAFLTSKDSLDLVPTPQQLIAQSVGLSNAIAVLVYVRYTRRGTALPCPYTS
ncbi:MAG: hypothetical protein V7L17_02525 [Nostoc sp.]